MQFLKFWGEALLASLSFGWVVFGIVSTAMPALFALVVRYWPPAANIGWIKWAADHQSELHVAIAVIFIAIYLFYAPYRVYVREHAGRIAAEQKVKSTPQPAIKLDVADVESRKEIVDLKNKLAAAEATIKQQQEARDPLSSSIASVRITLAINFKTQKEAASNYFGSGAGAMLISKTGEQMLSGGVAQHISDGDGHSQAVIDCPFDAPSMGKPIRSLSEAHILLLQFAEGFVPLNTELNAGHAVFVINNQITLNFKIPAQTVINKTVGAGGAPGTAIVMQNIEEGLTPLITPPSSNSDKSASQP